MSKIWQKQDAEKNITHQDQKATKKPPTRRGRRMVDGETLGDVAEAYLFHTGSGSDTKRVRHYLESRYVRDFSQDSIRAMLGRLKSEGRIEKYENGWRFSSTRDPEEAKKAIISFSGMGFVWYN